MLTFKTANLRISMWFLVPVALATGMLAATIAVGGFIGVPGLMYIIGATSIVASASELVIAFVMGLGGTLIWAYYGTVDIRLVMIILAGSLFGVQLGAIGTTYVKDYMIKYVMATIMLIVAVSRFLAIPKYLNELHVTSLSEGSVVLMSQTQFWRHVFCPAGRCHHHPGQPVQGQKSRTGNSGEGLIMSDKVKTILVAIDPSPAGYLGLPPGPATGGLDAGKIGRRLGYAPL